jgi:hypothetical protein
MDWLNRKGSPESGMPVFAVVQTISIPEDPDDKVKKDPPAAMNKKKSWTMLSFFEMLMFIIHDPLNFALCSTGF